MSHISRLDQKAKPKYLATGDASHQQRYAETESERMEKNILG